MSDTQNSSTKTEELAKLLDGHEMRAFDAVVAGLRNRAAGEGLVIVFGASDDRMELRGAIDDEIGAWNGGSAFIFDGKLLVNECDEGAGCPYFGAIQAKAFEVEALWCDDAVVAEASVDERAGRQLGMDVPPGRGALHFHDRRGRRTLVPRSRVQPD